LLLGSIWAAACAGENEVTDESLCTPERDPFQEYCNADRARVDLQTAFDHAQAAAPGDALLVEISDDRFGTMNPDGKDEAWDFLYLFAEPATSSDAPNGIGIRILANGDVFTSDAYVQPRCHPTQPISTLDSIRVAHDAVRRFEDTVGSVALGNGTRLGLRQSHECIGDDYFPKRAAHYVWLLKDNVYWFSHFTLQGSFLRLQGPCETPEPDRCAED
jgi:hypothetical protein